MKVGGQQYKWRDERSNSKTQNEDFQVSPLNNVIILFYLIILYGMKNTFVSRQLFVNVLFMSKYSDLF